MGIPKWNVQKIQEWLDLNAPGYKIIDDTYYWKIKVNLLCANNHIYNVAWDSFCNSGHRCPECNGIHFYTYEEVYNIFKENDCELVTKKEDYASTNQHLYFVCNKHKDKGIQRKVFNSFLKGHKCKYCGYESFANRIKLNPNMIIQVFYDANLTPLFTADDYETNEQKLPYVCNKHPECGIQYIDYTHLLRNQACYSCSYERTSGENHWNWKGGTTTINTFLHKESKWWKIDSFKIANNKCVITGSKKKKNVHHLYPFNKIRDEIIFSNKRKVNNFSIEKLLQIKDRFIQLQNNYGLGICLNEKIHQLFHNKNVYGQKNNTPQQFKEFVQRLESGEFDSYLAENNLTLNINYDILNKLLSQFNLSYTITK